MKEKVYKCSFKHCQHESCEVLQGEAVLVGKRHMHKDCSEISENIANIRDLYYEKISNTVVIKQLVSVINNLVFKKNIDAGYILFALNHAIVAKIPIKSPYGLHYLVDNKRIKDLWNKKQAEKVVAKMKEEMLESPNKPDVDEAKFNYIAEEKSGFGDIF